MHFRVCEPTQRRFIILFRFLFRFVSRVVVASRSCCCCCYFIATLHHIRCVSLHSTHTHERACLNYCVCACVHSLYTLTHTFGSINMCKLGTISRLFYTRYSKQTLTHTHTDNNFNLQCSTRKKTLNKNKNTHREGRSVRTYFNAINGIERSSYNNVEKKNSKSQTQQNNKKTHKTETHLCVLVGGREKRLTFYRLPASLPLANALLSQLTRRTPTQPFRQRHTIKECESRWQRESKSESEGART